MSVAACVAACEPGPAVPVPAVETGAFTTGVRVGMLATPCGVAVESVNPAIWAGALVMTGVPALESVLSPYCAAPYGDVLPVLVPVSMFAVRCEGALIGVCGRDCAIARVPEGRFGADSR
jgi:hypothetical protein